MEKTELPVMGISFQLACVAGVSKNFCEGYETGRECEKNLSEGNKTGGSTKNREQRERERRVKEMPAINPRHFTERP